MAIQDQNGFTRSLVSPPVGSGVVSLSSGSHSATHNQLDDPLSCGNDYALKARKPYTITKQRERWTDEEHNKFLEALKLYGRAWRRIEEHIGTKTAVQIRSHAQKFFSKVLRDSSGKITSTEDSIEIPPPRPKRKPIHPYPRKLATPRKEISIPRKEISIPEKRMKSNSLKSLDFDQENQSPKSVLSAVGSESLGSSDSDTPNGSLSPVSSISRVHTSGFTLAESRTPCEEASLNADSVHDEKTLMKFESFSAKEDAAEESSSRTLKLFGTTLFVTDEACKPSSPTIEACKPIPLDVRAHCLSEGHTKLELVGNSAPNETSTISQLRVRVRTASCGKGFVPYKRCMPQTENQSSSVTADDREEQCIQLSL